MIILLYRQRKLNSNSGLGGCIPKGGGPLVLGEESPRRLGRPCLWVSLEEGESQLGLVSSYQVAKP